MAPDYSDAARQRIVDKLKEKGHTAGYLKSLRKQLAEFDDRRARMRQRGPEPDRSNAAIPPADPEAGLTEDVKYLYTQLKQQGITDDSELATKAKDYTTAYSDYLANKQFYADNWAKIYGTALPDFSFRDNPFAMMAVNSTLSYAGFSLKDLQVKATNLKNNVASFNQLGSTGDFESFKTLNYSGFQELSKMFGSNLVSQAELAQLQAGTLNAAGGKTANEWETVYEDYRKKRKGLYSQEETKTAYGQSDDGFVASGLKSKQEY